MVFCWRVIDIFAYRRALIGLLHLQSGQSVHGPLVSIMAFGSPLSPIVNPRLATSPQVSEVMRRLLHPERPWSRRLRRLYCVSVVNVENVLVSDEQTPLAHDAAWIHRCSSVMKSSPVNVDSFQAAQRRFARRHEPSKHRGHFLSRDRRQLSSLWCLVAQHISVSSSLCVCEREKCRSQKRS